MTMNGAVLPVMAFFIVAGEEQGVPHAKLTGTIQNDILKEFAVRNTYIYPPEPSMRIVADIIAYCAAEMPKFNSISISGYHMHEAGATAVQELAYTLADGMEYVRARARPTGSTSTISRRACSFFFGIGMNLFMEVAKLRAARTLWHRIMTDLGAKNEKSKLLRTHCQTSGVSLTEQDPYNNIVRTTIEALAAVLGGTQSLHTNSFDEAIALPTDFSRAHRPQHAADPGRGKRRDRGRRSARRELLRREADPRAGGESLGADRGGRGAWRHDQGGRRRPAQAPHRGSRGGARGQGRHGRDGDRRRQPLSPGEEERAVDILEVDNAKVRAAQIAQIEKVRAGRDEAKVRAALDALEQGARGDENLLRTERRGRPRSLHARRDFGRAGARVRPLRHQARAGARDLRQGARATGAGRRRKKARARSPTASAASPRIMVAKMGQDGHDRGANLVSSAFTDLGFEVIPGPLFQTPRETAQMAVENDVDVVGASSLAAGHRTLIPEMIEALKDMGRADIKVVAGGVIPPQDYAALRAAGVQAIFGPGTNLADAADEVLRLLGHNRPPLDEAAE